MAQMDPGGGGAGVCSEPAQDTGSRVPSPPHSLLKPTVPQHSTFLEYSVVSEEASLCPPFDLDSVSWERKSRQNHAHFADVETGQERPRLTREAGESEAGMGFSARGGTSITLSLQTQREGHSGPRRGWPSLSSLSPA